MLVANRQEGFVKHRLTQLFTRFDDNEEISAQLHIIKPLINNYTIIFSACLKGKGQLSAITKQCYHSIDSNAFENFLALINKDVKIKRLWGSNTLSGYMALVEALLLKFEKFSSNNSKTASSKEKLSKAS